MTPGDARRESGPQDEFPITFVEGAGRVVVNFGIVTGREATQAEIDRLAAALRTGAPAQAELTITAARRQDYGRGFETVIHQVLVDVDCSADGADGAEQICRRWALDCAADRRGAPLPAD